MSSSALAFALGSGLEVGDVSAFALARRLVWEFLSRTAELARGLESRLGCHS